MKKTIPFCLILLPLLSFGQKKTEYYQNGHVKSEWKIDSVAGTNTNQAYFETGELKDKGIFDLQGVLLDFFHLNKHGDTINRSHIPEYKAQPKKDFGFISWTYTESGVGYYFETKGKGKKIETGDSLKVWYIGYFPDGSQFDNATINNYLLKVKIGDKKLLKSFEEGLVLFTRGQKGYIKIPPEIGYGNKAMADLPANSTLIYEVEVKE